MKSRTNRRTIPHPLGGDGRAGPGAGGAKGGGGGGGGRGAPPPPPPVHTDFHGAGARGP